MVPRLLRDDPWRRIESLLPGKAGDPGHTAMDNRLFVDAVLWIARVGAPWRDLPKAFAPWNSVYKRFSRGSNGGVWHRVFAALAQEPASRKSSLDSTLVRAEQQAAGAPQKTVTKRSAARATDRPPRFTAWSRGWSSSHAGRSRRDRRTT